MIYRLFFFQGGGERPERESSTPPVPPPMIAMGSGASRREAAAHRRLMREFEVGQVSATAHSPALLDLGHGSIHYREPSQRHGPSVRTGYFYHANHDYATAAAEAQGYRGLCVLSFLFIFIFFQFCQVSVFYLYVGLLSPRWLAC